MSGLICAICRMELSDARLLPCKHSFCEACLKRKFPKVNYDYRCSVCYLSFKRLTVSNDEFPINRFIEKLESLKMKMVRKLCNTCESLPALKYCGDCGKRFCEKCLTVHNALEHHRSHEIVDIKKKKIIKNMRKVKFKNCQTHDDKIDLYCKRCQKFICIRCSIINHKQHEQVDIFKQLDEEKLKLESAISRLKTSLSVYVQKLEKFEKIKDDDKNEILSQIRSNGDELKSEIDGYIEHLISKVEKHYDTYYYPKYIPFKISADLKKQIMEDGISALESKLSHLNVATVIDLEEYEECIPECEPFIQYKGIKFLPPKKKIQLDFKKLIGDLTINPLILIHRYFN